MELVEIEIAKIKPSISFKVMDEKVFSTLISSIIKHGQIRPVGLIKDSEDYICVYGSKIFEAGLP